MRINVLVTLKNGVMDAQGRVVYNALQSLGFEDVRGVRFGKLIQVNIETDDSKKALEQVDEMCRKLLANPVIEDYSLEAIEGEQ